MGNRKGTRADLALCKGSCGRMTHASTVIIDDAPEAVIRYKQGYCASCWDSEQLNRPMTEREIRAARALEIFMAKRRARLAARQRGLEQFRKTPIFGSIEVDYRKPLRVPMPEVAEPKEDNKPPAKNPAPERKSNAGRKMTLDYYQPEGTVNFYTDAQDAWCYVINSHYGEVLAKNEYGYRTLKHAKQRAKVDKAKLGWFIE